jgi:hypothetical protein
LKIITPGNHMNLEWTGEFECTGRGNGNHGCGAKLEIQHSDLFGTYNSCMGRDETWFVTFMCPCCGAMTDLANTDGYRHPDFPRTMSCRDFTNVGTQRVDMAREHLRSTGKYKNPKEFLPDA